MLKNISKKTPDPKEDEKLTEEVIEDIMRRAAEDPKVGDRISRILAMKNALDDAMGGGMWSIYSEYGSKEEDKEVDPDTLPQPKIYDRDHNKGKGKKKNIRKQGLRRPDDI